MGLPTLPIRHIYSLTRQPVVTVSQKSDLSISDESVAARFWIVPVTQQGWCERRRGHGTIPGPLGYMDTMITLTTGAVKPKNGLSRTSIVRFGTGIMKFSRHVNWIDSV